MDWLIELFTIGGGVAHTVILYAAVIAVGVFLGNKIKIKGITLGVTWILFIGILAGDLLMRGGIEENTAVITCKNTSETAIITDKNLFFFITVPVRQNGMLPPWACRRGRSCRN